MTDVNGNGHGKLPLEVLETRFSPQAEMARYRPRPPAFWPALVLFLLTVISTLAVGTEFALSYAQNREPFSSADPIGTVAYVSGILNCSFWACHSRSLC